MFVRDVMHSHYSETAYFESGGSVVVHLPDGGTTDIRAIIVEPK